MVFLSNSFHCCSYNFITTKCYQTGLRIQITGIVVAIVERLWKPTIWQVFTLWISPNLGTTLCGDQRSITVEHHKRRDTTNSKGIRKCGFRIASIIGQTLPWHLSKIFIEASLISVRRNEKYFHLVLQTILVMFCQLWSKATAWW